MRRVYRQCPSRSHHRDLPVQQQLTSRVELHQVRYFLAVADTLNFMRAAGLFNVSQPALTRAIQQLEEELGGLLLRREDKLMHLTDFARLIAPHLRLVLADAEGAKTTAKRFVSLRFASASCAPSGPRAS